MKIVGWSLLVVVSLLVVAAMTLFFWVGRTGGTWRSDRIRSSSELNAEIDHYTTLPDLRRSLLKHVPIGSKRNKVEAFIEANFDDDPHRRPAVPAVSSLDVSKDLLVCVRVFESGRISGGGWTECIFLFDEEGNLVDLIVDQGEAWL